MALAVLVSLSRGGVIALATGSTAFFTLLLLRGRGRAPRRGWVPSLILAGIAGLLLVALVPPEAHTRMRSLGGASFRLDTWRDGLRLALSSPITGSGLGAFHDAYPPFKRGHGLIRVEHAENDYVEVFAETGAAGLAILLTGVGLLLASAGRGMTAGGDPLARGVGLGAVAGLVALAVHSGVDFNLRIPSNGALAAVLAAAAAAAGGVRRRPLPRAAALGLSAGLLALLVAIAVRPLEPWLDVREEVTRAATAATPEARALRLQRAEGAVRRLLRRRPAHAESWLMLAGILAARGESASAAALARHAVALDPERKALRQAAEPLLLRATSSSKP
jgi:O-antigen ligase